LRAFPFFEEEGNNMSDANYERLSALDNSFLVLERTEPDTPMHVGSVAIFEGAPLRRADGRLDIDRIVGHVASRLHLMPRCRQRLAYVPIQQWPVWVDDDRFNILYHVRHTALPQPGDYRLLKRLTGRVMSQALDRGKPLWEIWVVEGLEDGNVAMINKAHHCMIDGIAGTDLMAVLMDIAANVGAQTAPDWTPRPAPSAAVLLRDEVLTRAALPLQLVSRAVTEPLALLREATEWAWTIKNAAGGVRAATPTPFNQTIGPHRRFDWTTTEIETIQFVRQRLGGTFNDVVLSTVASAVGKFMLQRGVALQGVEFRAFVPVNVRGQHERGKLGNRVAAWLVELPIAEPDPEKQLLQVIKNTARAKHSGQAKATSAMMEVSQWTGTTLLALAFRLEEMAIPCNMVVTNVPGPPFPLYFMGSRMTACHPLVPLGLNMALGIALLSNNGKLFWGFNADWELFPDLHDFACGIDDAIEQLRDAATQAGK